MALSAIILNSVDEQIKLLNVAPQIVPKLQLLLSDGNTNPDDILEMIRLDSAMAARVIKTSNAAYFNPGFRVSNIEDAVTYLGYDEVYRIITMLAFGRLMRSPLRCYGLEPGEVWRRGLACALSMDALSPLIESDRRNPYTIGLLHGIGMVFVDRQLTANKTQIPESIPEEKEVRLMGVNHAEVGAYVLRQWNFPELVTEPVRCQFDPLYCLTQGKMACLLYIAKCMMAAILTPPAEGESIPEPDPLVMTMVNLDADEFHDITEEAEGKFNLLEIAMIDL